MELLAMNKWIMTTIGFGLGAALLACAGTSSDSSGGAESEVKAASPAQPIAEKPISGYDFTGPQVAKKNDVLCSFFREPDESIACTGAGGVATQATDCKILCDRPIAEKGKVAGYTFKGFEILPSDK